jgi:PAS domain S-box-containing protein
MKKAPSKKTTPVRIDDLPVPAMLHHAGTGRILQCNAAARKLWSLSSKIQASLTFENLWQESLPLHAKRKSANAKRLGPFTPRRADGKGCPLFIHRKTVLLKGDVCFLDCFELTVDTPLSKSEAKQKQADEQIIADNEVSHAIINSLPGIFYLFDQQGRFLRWNKNFETVSGYSGAEIAVMHPLDFFEASDKPIVKEKIQSVFVTGMAEVEVDFLTKSGAKIPHYFNGWARDFEGEICLIGMGVDISARREAEHQAGHKARLIQDLLNGITDGFLATDRDLNFTLVNPAFCKFVERPEAEVLGKNLLDLLPFVKDTALEQHYRDAIKTGQPFSVENRMPPSPYQTFQINGYPNPGGIFIYYKDITIRKFAEQTLQESQNRLKAFFESTSDCILLLDPDLRVLDFNRIAERLMLDLLGVTLKYGLKLHDIEASSFRDILPHLTAAFTGQGAEFESELIYRNGQKEWWRLKLIPTQAGEDHIVAVALNGTNIDTLKRTSQRVITMADNIPEGFIYEYVVNAAATETVFTYASQGIEKLFEITADELLADAQMAFGLIDEADLLRVREASRTSRETLKNLEVDFRVRLASDKTKWVKAKATPQRRADGSTHFMALIMDITRQKKLEAEQVADRERIEKSENELRAIIEASAYATILLDAEGRIQNFNAYAAAHARAILNQDLEKGTPFALLMPAFFQPDFQTNFRRALNGEKVLAEREIQNVGGQTLSLEFLYLPVLDKNAHVTGVTFNVTDLTQKKSTEAQYKKSMEQMRFAARLAKFGEWEVDLLTRTSRWSDEVCRIHGVVPGSIKTLDEALGFYTDESRPFVENAVRKCIDSGDWYDLTVQIVLKTGRKKWVRTIGVSERVNNKAVKLYGLLQDIDDVKQQQEETARLALIAKNTNNLVVITGADRKIQWVNESFLRTTGYSQREVVGRSPGEFLQGPETDPATVSFVREKLDRQEPVKFEIINYKKNGEKYWLDIEIQPVFNASGELDYFIGMQSNITERKLADDSLKESLKEKENLIKEIHHRVKNNLQLISSILYLKMSGMHQSDMKDFLEDTRQKIRSIALIHERLLQSGSMHQVDVSDYLSKLILDIQMSLVSQTSPIHIHAHIAPVQTSLDVAINCGLILNELITNAIKHAFPERRGGDVSVAFEETTEGFLFTVTDNGIGLPVAVQPGKGGFGMQLLDVFLRQLKANVVVERDAGTTYIIRF